MLITRMQDLNLFNALKLNLDPYYIHQVIILTADYISQKTSPPIKISIAPRNLKKDCRF